MLPKEFKHKKEDSRWNQWIAGPVDQTILRMKQRTCGGEPIIVNGVTVYAMRFENGQEWNVKEGWV